MTDTEKQKLIEEYNALEKARDIESSKVIGSQSEINYLEDKMASIEARFQKAGDDIRVYL